MRVKLLLKVHRFTQASLVLLRNHIGTVNCLLQAEHTPTAGVLESHLTTRILRFGRCVMLTVSHGQQGITSPPMVCFPRTRVGNLKFHRCWRIDFERIECPECRERFVPGPSRRS
jgi:hypothetical protein